jgi:hypothetical protein
MNIDDIKKTAENSVITEAERKIWDNWEEGQESVTREVEVFFDYEGLSLTAEAIINFDNIRESGEFCGKMEYNYDTEVEKLDVWVLEKKII